MADNQLDPGFEEVSLDEGFEEVPMEATASVEEPKKSIAERALDTAEEIDILPKLAAVGPTLGKKALGFLGLAEDKPIKDIYSENVETMKDVRKGMLSGASFGGADEAQGALAAVAGKATGEQGSLPELYRKYQKMQEQKQKAAKERSPYAYGGGEIGGAIASALATGGLGIEAGLAKQMGSVGVKEALKQGGKLAAAKEMGKRALATGTEAAVAGGLQGGLSSEKTLEDASELAKDVVSGATFGAAAGAALRGASDTLPMVADTVGEFGMKVAKKPIGFMSKERADQMEEVWNRVRNDQPIEYEDLRLAGELEGIEDSILQKFAQARQTLGNKLGAAYKLAESEGRRVDLGSALEQASGRFQAYAKNSPALGFDNIPEYKKLIEKIYMIKDSKLSPLQARQLSQEVGALAAKLKNPQMSEIAQNFSQSVRQSLEQAVPEAATLSKQYHQFNKFGLETLAGKGRVNPLDVSGFNAIDKMDERQAVQWLLRRITTPGVPQEEVSNALHYMKKNLSALEQQSPGVFDALGIKNIDELDEMFKDKSKLYSIANVMSSAAASRGGEPIAKNPVAWLAQGISPILTKGLYAGTKVAAKGTNKLVNFGRDILALPDEQLGNVAQGLIQSDKKGAQAAGQFLKDAVQSKDVASRNAALFVIQQNPQYRNLVKEMIYGAEDEGNEQQ